MPVLLAPVVVVSRNFCIIIHFFYFKYIIFLISLHFYILKISSLFLIKYFFFLKWIKLISNTGSSCSSGKKGCLISEPRIRSCLCQENLGCLERADCGGFRPRGTAATGACPGPCQCVEEEAWNINSPPKPNCEWLSNFSQLRRQWSDHSRLKTCKCCNCLPW